MSEKPIGESGTSPKHVFMYLLLITMLYVSVVSFILVIFQYINILLPDPLNNYVQGFYQTIRHASSSLIVAFPVYLLMSWLLQKEYVRIPEAKQLKTRKWLVYLTLFIAAITVIVDLIQLINNFYSGELTWSFTWKMLTILLVAASVFGYHLWDLQKEISGRARKIMAGIVSTVVLAVLICGFFIAGSPAHQRKVRFDEQRVSDLQSLQYQILNYWQTTERLPASLSDLEDNINGYRPSADPATGQPYIYEVKNNLSFTLCAEFSTKNNGEGQLYPYKRSVPYPISEFGEKNDNWNHEIGKICFDRKIDPERHGLPK